MNTKLSTFIWVVVILIVASGCAAPGKRVAAAYPERLQEPTNGKAALLIYSPPGLFVNASYQIYLDGSIVGTVYRGICTHIEVAPGHHKLSLVVSPGNAVFPQEFDFDKARVYLLEVKMHLQSVELVEQQAAKAMPVIRQCRWGSGI